MVMTIEKKYGLDKMFGYDKEKDYSYDKMSYKHDDQKYGYDNSYKSKDPKIKYIKCNNWNINGRNVEQSTGDIGSAIAQAQAQSSSDEQQALGANPFVMGGDRIHKQFDKDVVVVCIFNNGEKDPKPPTPPTDPCVECFTKNLSPDQQKPFLTNSHG